MHMAVLQLGIVDHISSSAESLVSPSNDIALQTEQPPFLDGDDNYMLAVKQMNQSDCIHKMILRVEIFLKLS